jgi:putative ABC transport system substrate-binding protein
MEVRQADELERAFAIAASEGAGALIVFRDFFIETHRTQILHLAAQRRLPAIAWVRTFAEGGLLMTYGPDELTLYRRTAYYVDRILKGIKPADLPVEQPTKFEFVINLTTAQALGITMPPSLLILADEVIK